MPEYLLSVSIPSFNMADQTIAAVRSVGQHDEVQVVVVDDGSDLGVYSKLVEGLAGYKGVKLIRNDTNIGLTPNWNRCVDQADGLWVSMLFCDDHFKPGAVGRILDLVRASQPGLILQYPSIAEERLSIGCGVEAVRRMRLPIVSGNVWHRDIWRAVGGFNPNLKYSPDGELWFRMASVYPTLLVKDPFAIYECHASNFTWKSRRKDDFLEQVALLARLNASFFLPGAPEVEWDRFVGEGVWATLVTIFSASCSPGREDIYLKYVPEIAGRIDSVSRLARFLGVLAGAREIPLRGWIQALCNR